MNESTSAYGNGLTFSFDKNLTLVSKLVEKHGLTAISQVILVLANVLCLLHDSHTLKKAISYWKCSFNVIKITYIYDPITLHT